MANVIDNDFHPVDSGLEATDDHWGTQLAGDVVPLRPANSPASNAGRQNQIKNEQRQSPNSNDPKIARIYG